MGRPFIVLLQRLPSCKSQSAATNCLSFWYGGGTLRVFNRDEEPLNCAILIKLESSFSGFLVPTRFAFAEGDMVDLEKICTRVRLPIDDNMGFGIYRF